MAAFHAGDIQLLVGTTVIEVGVNVPNASLMVIENPERLGLAQLHQLRGRIGRGDTASFCILLYHPPLTPVASERIGLLRKSCDGFEIAQSDLALRGPGEWLGTQQTGSYSLKIADLIRDKKLLPQVEAVAAQLFNEEPMRTRALIARWVAHREAHYAWA